MEILFQKKLNCNWKSLKQLIVIHYSNRNNFFNWGKELDDLKIFYFGWSN